MTAFGRQRGRQNDRKCKTGKLRSSDSDPNFTVLHFFVLLFIQIVPYQRRIYTLLSISFLFCTRHEAELLVSVLTQLKVVLLIRTFSLGFIV